MYTRTVLPIALGCIVMLGGAIMGSHGHNPSSLLLNDFAALLDDAPQAAEPASGTDQDAERIGLTRHPDGHRPPMLPLRIR